MLRISQTQLSLFREVISPCPASCPTKVKFLEHGKKWGWDDYTDPALPWISIKSGDSDTVKARAEQKTDTSYMCNVTYASSDETIASVSPESGTNDNQVLTISGKKKGEATISATCNGKEIGKLMVAVKDLLKKKITVQLIHEKSYKSTDCSDARIKKFLKTVYKQAVVEFTVTRIPAATVEFDIDKSDTLNVLNGWPSDEVKKIIDEVGDTSYDFNVFFVDNPNDDSLGWSDFNNAEKAAVAHVKSGGREAAVAIEMTVAHEAGHGMFGLPHPEEYTGTPERLRDDPDNLMTQGDSLSQNKLRKYQWDLVNP